MTVLGLAWLLYDDWSPRDLGTRYPDDHGVQSLPDHLSGYDTACVADALERVPIAGMSPDRFELHLPEDPADSAFVVVSPMGRIEADIGDGMVVYRSGLKSELSIGPDVRHCL